MSFNIDTGSEGFSGPFVNWHAMGRQDGSAGARSFSLSEDDVRTDITEKFKNGVIFDIENMKTGWALFGPGGTDWQWNASISRFESKPGDDWKKGVFIPVALGDGEAGSWAQAGSGTFMAIKNLAPQLKDGGSGKLPMIKMTGSETITFGTGSTVSPTLEVVDWVDRPACLNSNEETFADEPVEEEY